MLAVVDAAPSNSTEAGSASINTDECRWITKTFNYTNGKKVTKRVPDKNDPNCKETIEAIDKEETKNGLIVLSVILSFLGIVGSVFLYFFCCRKQAEDDDYTVAPKDEEG